MVSTCHGQLEYLSTPTIPSNTTQLRVKFKVLNTLGVTPSCLSLRAITTRLLTISTPRHWCGVTSRKASDVAIGTNLLLLACITTRLGFGKGHIPKAPHVSHVAMLSFLYTPVVTCCLLLPPRIEGLNLFQKIHYTSMIYKRLSVYSLCLA